MNSVTDSKPMLSSRVYDRLKWITQIFLPASGTLYFSLSGIWNFPNGQQVVGTITAIVFFLGILLNISSTQYKNSDARFSGEIDIDDEQETSVLRMDSFDLLDKEEITLRVNRVDRPKKRK